MKSSVFEKYFDREFYLSQVEAQTAGGLYKHYCRIGHQQNLDPNTFFCTEWYKWQNPDWTSFANPLEHYLETGRHEGRDPSPKVDVQRYAEQYGLTGRYGECFDRILQGQFGLGDGVYRSWADLWDARDDFWRPIQVTPIRLPSCQATRRNLVFVQHGSSGHVMDWLQDSDRDFDIMLNCYDAWAPRLEFAEYVFCQPGTKFTAIAKLLEGYPSLFQAYDHILFLDDDILLSNEAVNQAFASCRTHALDLAQMALSPSSHCIWDVFFSRGGQEIRTVNGVEIMMPIVSRHALQLIGNDFGKSVSGFGLDFLFSKRVGNPERSNIGILNRICADHLNPVDDRGGTYYSYLRSRGINPKAELWYLITTFGLERGFYEIS